MNTLGKSILLLGLSFTASVLLQAEPINLAGPKDRVIAVNKRENVLSVADRYLSKTDDGFVARVTEIENPFLFEQPVIEQETGPVVAETIVEAAPVVYDDASVLKAVAATFSPQVRGTLSRGADHYLQLQGGSMLKAGSSFPVRLPELEDSFTVTVSEIGAQGYTLQLGEAELYLPYESNSNRTPGGGATRFSTE